MKNTALLVIDFINDIVNSEGKLKSCAEYCATHDVFTKANTAISYAERHNMLILFVKVGFSTNYIECPKGSLMFAKAAKHGALALGEWGTEFDSRINAQFSDAVIIKHRVSCFYNTDLETILSANEIDTIMLTGVSTEMAILTTAREAHDRDYKVVVLSDACGARDATGNEAALHLMRPTAQIMTVDELLSFNT